MKIKAKAKITISLLCITTVAALFAQNLSAEQETESIDVTEGTWRDGKAVFSDVPLLDVFWGKLKRGYQPEQPIPYSHALHTQKVGLECSYCHSGVSKSSFATVPSMELCMGCHASVKTESEHIKQLTEAYEAGKPIEWEPVNNLPEHANFNHERHSKAGVGCQTCHGGIQYMEVVEKAASLKMGWCMSCHRENGVSIDCATCHN